MIEKLPAKNYYEQYFGFKATEDGKRVTAIAPGSEADKSGLGKDDEIISVNDIKVENNLNELCKLFEGRDITLVVSTQMKKVKSILLEPTSENYFLQYKLRKKPEATTEQQKFFNQWLKALW
jgi:C-terminal processing protease CtpA/Prc